MEFNDSVVKYNISNHAKQRYSERIMGKDTNYDINKFILEHEQKIQEDINKMVEFGELIYSGRQSQKDGKGNIIDVYLNGCWVVLVDSKNKNTVITLYKIDLGLDDEFNKTYISKMIEKLNTYKDILNDVQEKVQNESSMYKEMISDAESQIKEYRIMIKNLEDLCVGYKSIIDNNIVKVTQANRDVADVLNALIGKKEF